MLIHKDQQNIRALCELADFIDSGYQSYREQVTHLTGEKRAEAAFYAGAGLAMKLQQHFADTCERYPPGAADYLAGLVIEEINQYMEKHRMKIEWEPHVPRSWQQ
jgi:hypothetical protein